jgi:hypothetical protein
MVGRVTESGTVKGPHARRENRREKAAPPAPLANRSAAPPRIEPPGRNAAPERTVGPAALDLSAMMAQAHGDFVIRADAALHWLQ